jgi:hypothetical protein
MACVSFGAHVKPLARAEKTELQSMPRIVEYKTVLQRMLSDGFVSLYHHSGAFGFSKDAKTQAIGWIGAADPTLRPEASALARQVGAPIEENLVQLLIRAWRGHLSGTLWLMPMSHWAYELDFASRAWMPNLLRAITIDPALLESRNDGAAIEFGPAEDDALRTIVLGLLQNLSGSDFTIAFPGRDALCTLHHHKQLWWTTRDASRAQSLRELISKT